jgi:hypothetical protein
MSKKSGKSFSSFFKLGGGLNVDLSEAEMKNSEATLAPLSSRPGSNNAISKSQAPVSGLDSEISSSRFGVTTKRGNYRRTQEDRVCHISLKITLLIPII